MRKIFRPLAVPARTSMGFLLVRLLTGVALMFHGWPKIQAPLNWMGPDAPVPGALQALAALAEFGGGMAWILGLLMPLASLGVACVMTVAIGFHTVVRGDPFVDPGGSSYELATLYLVITLLFLLSGPGRYSLDSKIFR